VVIETFLTPPRRPAEFAADTVRALGTVSVVVAGLVWGAVAFWVCALSLLGVYAARFLGFRPALDIGLGITLLVAAWSSVLDLYTTVTGWDLVVHFVANGLLAAAFCIMLVRAGVLPGTGTRVQAAAQTVFVGLGAAVVWEIAEWVGHNFVDPTIYVAYDDTIGDLVAGGLGSVVAGLALPVLAAGGRVASSAARVVRR
jgi:hypothetical protein